MTKRTRTVEAQKQQKVLNTSKLPIDLTIDQDTMSDYSSNDSMSDKATAIVETTTQGSPLTLNSV